jgi:curli biogenesis system outer membrane secretion channel CsgG
MLRLWIIGTIGLCMLALGCAQVGEYMNPSPTTGDNTASAQKLRSIPPPDPAHVKTVTVYDIQDKTGWQWAGEITQGMTDQLITALIKTHHFQVVERATLGDVMTERNLQASGEASGGASDSQLAGAQYIFAGATTELDETGGGGIGVGGWGGRLNVDRHTASVGLDIRVIDVNTGVIVDSIDVRKTVASTGFGGGYKWAVSANYRVSNAMDQAVRQCIEEAVYQLVARYGAAQM